MLDRLAVRYTRWLIDHRVAVLVGALLFAAFCAFALRTIRLNGDYSVFFPEDDPKVHRFVETSRQYTNNASIFYVLTARDGDVFAPRVLEANAELTAQAWVLPQVVRVDSITNYQDARWQDGRLVVGTVFDDPAGMSEAALADGRKTILNAPMLRDRIINPEGSVTGINVQVEDDTPELVREAEALKARIEATYPEVTLGMTGVVMLNNGFKEATIQDILTLTPIVLVVLMATMAVLLRSFSLTLAVFAVIGLSVLSAMGIASLLRLEISGPVAPAPIMIMTLAVANCVHILVSMLWQARHGATRDEALVESMRLNLGPVFLTSLTTTIGFGSMTIRAVPPIQVMALVTAIGVMLSFVYAVTFMPALAAMMPLHARLMNQDRPRRIEAFGEWVIRRRRALFWSFVAASVTLSAFIPTIEFNNQFVNFLKERVPIRRDTDYAARHLTGIFQVTYSIDAAGPGGVCDPAYLAGLDAFRAWLLDQRDVTHVESVSTTMKRLNQLMAKGDAAAYRLPESKAKAERMLKLYGASLPKGLSLRSVLNEDWSASRVVVTTNNMRSRELDALAERSEAWLREHTPAYMHAEAMGPWVLFADISKLMRRSMVISTPLALVLVSAALIVALRSLKFGLVSLVPNLLPLAAAYGAWGLLGQDMDLAMVGVMAMGIGIIVDDTVHFMSKYLRARREKDLTPADAVRYAFASVGTALVVTSFVLVAGFLSLLLSVFTTSVNMGLLTTLVIAFALAGDLLFLPTLLLRVDR